VALGPASRHTMHLTITVIAVLCCAMLVQATIPQISKLFVRARKDDLGEPAGWLRALTSITGGSKEGKGDSN